MAFYADDFCDVIIYKNVAVELPWGFYLELIISIKVELN